MGSQGKYAGRPLTVKCPKCKRGKYGERKIVFGILRHEQKRNPRPRTHKSTTLTRCECRDCGHQWWTTLIQRYEGGRWET